MHVNILQFILVSLCVVIINTEECPTVDGKRAECISLYHCPEFLDELITQRNSSLEIVRQSHCGTWSNATDPKVCCRTLKNKTTSTSSEINRLLSDKRFCGYQHIDDYYLTGNDTGINEFPWLAVFIYKYDEDLHVPKKTFGWFGCAGSIINARYIITAAQCLRRHSSTVVAVRLGEQNIKNETDCVKFADLDDCNNPVEDVGIEKNIIHPEYNQSSGVHDIALIRLNRTLFFTDFIRPICLPLPGTKLAKIGETFTTAGFYSIIKKKVYTQLITNEECEREFSVFPDRKRHVNEDVICTRDLTNDTAFSCEGDAGAPIMISRRRQWHIEGFKIWGANPCGLYFPRVHIKIINYMDWIEKSVTSW